MKVKGQSIPYLIPMHLTLLVHYLGTYVIIIDKIIITKATMMMENSSTPEDQKPMHLLHGPLEYRNFQLSSFI